MNFLMLLSFFSLWIMVGNNEREPNWRLALVQTAVVWGGFLVLGTELLHLFSAINRLALVLMWTLPIIVGILWTWLWLKKGKVLRLPIIYHRDSWVGLALDFLVILILVITAIVAFVAPPNSHEAMVTGMSRVTHWEQNHSLAHYPTGIESQNGATPGAELIFLNFYIVGGGDGAVNLVAWFSFAGCIAAAASLAEALGAKKNGQRLAAIFVATLPGAITHATGAMNDIVVAFWVVSTALMLTHLCKRSLKPLNLILTGLAGALAILTKPTALFYLYPMILMLVVLLFVRRGFWKMLGWAGIILIVVALVNGGYCYRNQQTYGSYYYPAELAEQLNDVQNMPVLVSNIARNAALHADMPFPRADNWLRANLQTLHGQLRLDISDPRTTLEGSFYIPEVNTSEMTSGNPLHAAMIVLSFVAVVAMVLLGKQDPDILVYTSLIFISLILFNYYLKWRPSGGRLQLPIFILFAPIVAVLFDWIKKYKLQTVLAVTMLIYAAPWLFQTQERPVIPNRNTFHLSVFNKNPTKLYFATHPQDYKTYWVIANGIKERGLNQIGLHLTPNSEEYPFWALLVGPDEDDFRMEWVATPTASPQYLSEEFSPDAVICEACPPEIILQYSDNYEHLAYDGFDLFLKEER